MPTPFSDLPKHPISSPDHGHPPSGLTITTPAGGTPTITLETPGGRKIVLDDASGSIAISDPSGNEIVVTAAGIEIRSGAVIRIEAAAVEIVAATTKISGIVIAEAVQAQTVIAASITPGAGNIW